MRFAAPFICLTVFAVGVIKKPFFKGWTQDATIDSGQITRWQRKAALREKRYCPKGELPFAPNWSILTGRANNVVIIDIDGARGRASLAEHEKKLGKIPKTVMTQSGRVDGGTHIWLRPPPGVDDVMNQQPISGTKLDIRGWHGHAVIPGSLHMSGARYSWAPGHPTSERNIAAKTISTRLGTQKGRVAFLARIMLPDGSGPVT